ncbi:MAG: hypothetical protein KF845_02880 [Cyclobacteriaceae bacterium]|nr:hypothetical protein [Cyclobacteriaceae bacterium]
MTNVSKEKRNPIAFSFVLELLLPIEPVIKPMFGCHALYVGEKIVLITRNKPQHPEDNGVWVCLHAEHLTEIKKEFPSLRSVQLLGSKETRWQNLSPDAADFEESISKICELIRKGDQRIGKIPTPKKKKTTPPR